MSRFGQDQLAEFDALYVPHGVDTNRYRPLDRKESRRRLGLEEDGFLVGMVAANKDFPSRKSFPEAFQAFKNLRDRHPDARLYLHTEATGQGSGLNLPHLLAQVGIPPESVGFPDQHRLLCTGFGDEHMVNLYSAFDVLLNPAAGEGFGVPIVEAQACGTPVIVTDWTAMRELCGAGWKVTGQRAWTFQQSWQMVPSVDDLSVALLHAYQAAGRLRDDAREFALQYDADRVLQEHFLPALAEVARRHDARAAERDPGAHIQPGPVELEQAA
jgi:glycosyltransferase involved in cell wall biosynthesis